VSWFLAGGERGVSEVLSWNLAEQTRAFPGRNVFVPPPYNRWSGRTLNPP
jgi:hypothetical protein